MKHWKKWLRIVWVGAGLSFLAWMWWGYRASGVPAGTFDSTGKVLVIRSDAGWEFRPAGIASEQRYIFLPGGMVDPEAYGPLMRKVAEAGHRAVLLKYPWNCGCTDAQVKGVFDVITRTVQDGGAWSLGGHSRGAMLAARFVHERNVPLAGLILIGTSHPRDFSLASITIPVLKISATEDGVAGEGDVSLLPPSTRYVKIAGGNHVQFGFYGHQLFDGRAKISREEQQRQVLAAMID